MDETGIRSRRDFTASDSPVVRLVVSNENCAILLVLRQRADALLPC